MKTYLVNATMYIYLQAEIQADSLEEAEAIAREMDGSEFAEQPNQSDWQTHWDKVREKPITQRELDFGIEKRNFHGFYQCRESAACPWQFVITGFCYDDTHCHVLKWDRTVAEIPINEDGEIQINGKWYGRECWYH